MVIRARQICFGIYSRDSAHLDMWLYGAGARYCGDGVRLCVFLTYK